MPYSLSGSFFSSTHRSTFATIGLVAGAMLCTLPAAAVTPTSLRAKSINASVKHKPRKSSHSSLRHADTPAIAAERATEIQAALIRKGYLSGEPSGTWDGQTIAAMQKLQSDNGWQSKITPDARALIKLGLGPTQNSTLPSTPK